MLDPTLAAVGAALLGLAVGSFLNVVIHRLPKMMEAEWRADCAELEGRDYTRPEPYNLLRPRSACPHCGAPIRALQNVPLLSFAIQKGRCADCRAPISWRYPAVEALTAALSVWVILQFGASAAGGLALLLVWTLIALTFIDAETTFLPDNLTLPLLWLGLLANLWGVFVTIDAAVIGAMAGYLSLWSVYWLFKLTTGREGMGHGDFKLLAALGAWLGWKMLLPIVLMASVVGAVVGVVLIALRARGRDIPIPFGPYLAAGGFIALIAGPQLARLVPL